MAKERPTFEELVRRVGPLPGTGLASAESPPVSAASVRAARTLVGGLPSAESRVARVAAKLDRLVELSKSAEHPRKRTQNG
jgi:hypothetical protein